VLGYVFESHKKRNSGGISNEVLIVIYFRSSDKRRQNDDRGEGKKDGGGRRGLPSRAIRAYKENAVVQKGYQRGREGKEKKKTSPQSKNQLER